MRIIFLTNLFDPVGSNCLKALLDDNKNIVGIFIYNYTLTKPLKFIKDIIKRKGWIYLFRKACALFFYKSRVILRKLKLSLKHYYSFPELSTAYKIKNVHYINEVFSPSFIEKVREMRPDLIVVCIFSRILKKEIINIPGKGCINLHPSLLPKYRGPNPYFWVVHNKENETGITVHYIDEGIDSGNIIAQRTIPIEPLDTEYSLRQKITKIAPSFLLEVIDKIENGFASSFPQDNSIASYFPEPSKEMSSRI